MGNITVPNTGLAIKRFDQVIADIKPRDFAESRIVDAGDPLNPVLNNLPAYTLEWKESGESDNKYMRAFARGNMIVRVYTSKPKPDNKEGLIRLESLVSSVKHAIMNNKMRLMTQRMAFQGAFNEPVSYRPDVYCKRVEFKITIHTRE